MLPSQATKGHSSALHAGRCCCFEFLEDGGVPQEGRCAGAWDPSRYDNQAWQQCFSTLLMLQLYHR